jgi:hypothetical protein
MVFLRPSMRKSIQYHHAGLRSFLPSTFNNFSHPSTTKTEKEEYITGQSYFITTLEHEFK